MNTPAVMLADEPTGNLDSKNSQEIVELLRLSNQKYGQTLIIITHDENIALQATASSPLKMAGSREMRCCGNEAVSAIYLAVPQGERSRTLVTIIGIILSVALLTAVAAGAYSGQQYMVEVCQAMEGNYHAFGEELSKEALAKLENEAQVTSVATLGAHRLCAGK